MAAKLSVARPDARFGKVRKLFVKVDGAAVGHLLNASTGEFEVSAGNHAVTVHMDWCSSRPASIDLKDGEKASLAVGMPEPSETFGVIFTPRSLFQLTRMNSSTPT